MADWRKLLLTEAKMSIQDKFHNACTENDRKIVRKLVKYRDKSGLDINYRYGKGLTALMHVAVRGYTDIVRILLDCAEIDVDMVDDIGGQAIHRSAQFGYPDIIELLLGKGASVNTQTAPGFSWSGQTPLRLACVCLKGKFDQTPTSPAYDLTGCAQVLLKNGADVNLASVEGWTPLHFVCIYDNNTDIINLFLSHGADINKQENKGHTALAFACQSGFTSAVDVLLTRKADPEKADNEGFTPLMIAIQIGHLSCVELLVKHKANINAQNKQGVTALMAASVEGHLSVVKLLILAQASVNIKSNVGNSALHLACIDNCTEVAECLIRAGADFSCQDFDGFTPLLASAALGHVSCVELLLSWGSKFDWTGQMSPLTIAKTENHTEVVRVLEIFRADKSRYIRSPSLLVISIKGPDPDLTRFSTLALADGDETKPVIIERGGNVTFVSTIDGKPEPEITCQRNGQLVSECSDIKIELKKNVCYLHLYNCTLTMSGKISLLATNCHGQAAVGWMVQVIDEPVKPFVDEIQPISILEDEEAIFDSTVTGSQIPKVTSSFNNSQLSNDPLKVSISASGETHQLRLREIKPGKHTVTVVASNLCGKVEKTAQLEVKGIHIFDIAKEFLSEMKIPEVYLDHKYDMCFCDECHAARGDNPKYPTGKPAIECGLPLGWCKFGLQTKPQAIAKNIFKDWHVAFHGTKVENVNQILDVGDLLLPGDLTSTGSEISIPRNHFRPDHSRSEMRPPPGHDTQKFYLSPSIKYAGLEVYAPAWGWKNPQSGNMYKVRTAFQVRIEPGSYDISRHTVRATGQIDPLFPNSQLEWSTKRRGVSMLVGLLVKIESGMMEADAETLQQIMREEQQEQQDLFEAAP